MSNLDTLDADKIKSGLPTERLGQNIIVLGSVTGTNDIAAEYTDNADNDGLTIFAEEQTAGRGRWSNKWLSARGDSILCSVVLINENLGNDLLSLAAAVAVVETLGAPAKIKWPNDIMIAGKKAAGILLESKSTRTGGAHILGIGINCHQKKFTGELASTATSIDLERNSRCHRITLCRRLLSELEGWIDEAKSDATVVIQAWQDLSTQLHHRIKVIYDGKAFSGTCVGIDPQKGLVVELEHGGRRFFPAAQTSIAK